MKNPQTYYYNRYFEMYNLKKEWVDGPNQDEKTQ